jgi:cell division protein FtsW
MGYIFALLALISVGVIMVYSTTAFYGPDDVERMVMWLGLGVVALVVSASVPLSFWRKAAPWLLVACMGLLISLLFKGANPLAVEANGAYRWLKVPVIGQFQPSEPAKLAFVLFAARFLERRGQRMTAGEWAVFVGTLGLLAGSIYKEPDLGTAMALVGSAFCMLIAAGVRISTMVKGILVLAVLIGTMAWNTPHQRERLLAWQNPWAQQYAQDSGYQVIQSMSAMSRGGLGGVGLGQSIHKLGDRLPEAETDFIFAIVAEEMGLFRAIAVLVLFGLLSWRGYGIAARAPDRYSALVAVGVTSWIAVQACLNLAVVTGTVPNTGVPLPFISSGGSSIVSLMAATGVVIGISRLRRTGAKDADGR